MFKMLSNSSYAAGNWIATLFAEAGALLTPPAIHTVSTAPEMNFHRYYHKFCSKLTEANLSLADFRRKLEKLTEYACEDNITPETFTLKLLGSNYQGQISSGNFNLKNKGLLHFIPGDETLRAKYQAACEQAVKAFPVQKAEHACSEPYSSSSVDFSSSHPFTYGFFFSLTLLQVAQAFAVPRGIANLGNANRLGSSNRGEIRNRQDIMSRQVQNGTNKALTPEDYGFTRIVRERSVRGRNLPAGTLFSTPQGNFGFIYQNANNTKLLGQNFMENGQKLSGGVFDVLDRAGNFGSSNLASVSALSDTEFAIATTTSNNRQFILQIQHMSGLPILCNVKSYANPNSNKGYIYDVGLAILGGQNQTNTRIVVITSWANQYNPPNNYKLNVYWHLFDIHCKPISVPGQSNPITEKAIPMWSGERYYYNGLSSITKIEQTGVMFGWSQRKFSGAVTAIYYFYFALLNITTGKVDSLLNYFKVTVPSTVSNPPYLITLSSSADRPANVILSYKYSSLNRDDDVLKCYGKDSGANSPYATSDLQQTLINNGTIVQLTTNGSGMGATVYLNATSCHNLNNLSPNNLFAQLLDNFQELTNSSQTPAKAFYAASLPNQRFVFVQGFSHRKTIDYYYKIVSINLAIQNNLSSIINYIEGSVTYLTGISFNSLSESSIKVTVTLPPNSGTLGSLITTLTAAGAFDLPTSTWVAAGDQLGLNQILQGLYFNSTLGFFADFNSTLIATDGTSPPVNLTLTFHGTAAPRPSSSSGVDNKFLGIGLTGLVALIIASLLAYLEIRYYRNNQAREKHNAFANHIYRSCQLTGCDEVSSPDWQEFVRLMQALREMVLTEPSGYQAPIVAPAVDEYQEVAQQAKGEALSLQRDEDANSSAPQKNAMVEQNIIDAMNGGIDKHMVTTKNPKLYSHWPYFGFFKQVRQIDPLSDLERHAVKLGDLARAYVTVWEEGDRSVAINKRQLLPRQEINGQELQELISLKR